MAIHCRAPKAGKYNTYARKKYKVQAASVEDFRKRYTRPSAYQQRGAEYVAAVLESARRDLEKYGYTIISRHDSITGDVVAYYGKEGG